MLDSIRSVQKILGEPIACELSDRAWKTRTLLLSVEGIAAVIAFGHLRVDPNATAFGLSLRGLTDHEVRLWLCLEQLKCVVAVARITLNVRTTNARAISCYLRCGFKTIRTSEKQLADGSRVHYHTMIKELREFEPK